MGGIIACVKEDTETYQRLRYDLEPIHSRQLPMIWLVGGPGRNNQAEKIATQLNYVNIKVTNLLTNETENDTDRSQMIKHGLHHRDQIVPDSIIIDLIKEEMLRTCRFCEGFVINNFPRTAKQADLFTMEIEPVNCLIYLATDMIIMMEKVKRKHPNQKIQDEALKKSIQNYHFGIQRAIRHYGDKLEKIDTGTYAEEVSEQIITAIQERTDVNILESTSQATKDSSHT